VIGKELLTTGAPSGISRRLESSFCQPMCRAEDASWLQRKLRQKFSSVGTSLYQVVCGSIDTLGESTRKARNKRRRTCPSAGKAPGALLLSCFQRA